MGTEQEGVRQAGPGLGRVETESGGARLRREGRIGGGDRPVSEFPPSPPAPLPTPWSPGFSGRGVGRGADWLLCC